jgi:hypothetical protein
MTTKDSSKYYIYYHIDPRNGFPVYIGKGSGKRAYVMYNRNYKHNMWVKELNRLGLSPVVFIGNHFSSEEECYRVEKIEIDVFKKLKVSLVNLADGGLGGLSNVCRKKIICLNSNKVYDSTKQAADELGIKSKRICDVLKGRKPSYKGFKFKYLNEDLNAVAKKRRDKAEVFNKHTTSKPVLCVETNIRYISIKEAAKENGVSSAAISLVLSGKNKKVKNLTFKRL